MMLLKNKVLLLATVGLLEMYYLKYPLEMCLLYFNAVIILGTAYKIIASRKKSVVALALPVKVAEAKDEFQVKFERKLLDLYNKQEAEKRQKAVEALTEPETNMIGKISEIKEDNSITHELTELSALYNQIRLMNQKLKATK